MDSKIAKLASQIQLSELEIENTIFENFKRKRTTLSAWINHKDHCDCDCECDCCVGTYSEDNNKHD